MPSRGARRQDQFRLRVRYRKDGRLAFLGHLEVINTVNRCVRRSGLPFAVGAGFARRMRLQFSQALPVGASSREEFFDLWLTERVEADRALAALAGATPASLAPSQAGYVAHELPSLEAWLDHSLWRVGFLGPVDEVALARGVQELEGRGEFSYRRGDALKRVSLQDTLMGWRQCGSGAATTLELSCATGAAATLRPRALVTAALASQGVADVPALRVERLAQWHEQDGRRMFALVPDGDQDHLPPRDWHEK